jgi:pyrimidine-nucleoside phosphorylase
MNPVELIRKKRNGNPLSKDELHWFLGEFVDGNVPDYQMSAFLMAVYFRGMTPEETAMFTDVMLHSGEVIDLSSLPGVKVDKHSTGGVGDKVSLILAPMVAACGVPVPMISGRGLGHTGGTLDKLEAITGFRTRLSIQEYRSVLEDVGVVLAGQTDEVAPADRRMYALRDVTGTIESVPLIAGSIMSKKLAEGIDALVLDVKFGDGAFMQEYDRALALARTLVGIGASAGKQTLAFLTAMHQPLGYAIGNWCEVVETIECLKGRSVPDLMEVTYVLGGAMLYLGGKASSIEEGMKRCRSAIWSGKAYEKFLEVVRRQGGDVNLILDPARYPKSAAAADVASVRSGVITGFATRALGLLAIDLGAGRRVVSDRVDPKAGIILRKKLGDRVESGEPIATIFTDRKDMVEDLADQLLECVTIAHEPVQVDPPVHSLVTPNGVSPWTTPQQY